MSEREITSAENYVKLVSVEANLPSGAVFRVRAPNAYELVELLKVLPDEPPVTDDEKEDGRTFLRDYLPKLWEPIVYPCILEPKVPIEIIPSEDALVLLDTVLSLTGARDDDGDNGESFPDPEPSPDP